MSHVTRVKTVICSKDHLKKALDDLAYKYEEGKFFITANSDREEVELLVQSVVPGSQIGFRNSDQGWVLACNMIGALEARRGGLNDKLAQRYAYNMVRQKLEEQGFRVDEEVMEKESKEIHLVLRRTA